ncbi:hypothetical protein HEPPS_05800 [Candidatus Hepatoplasma crinochetorum]|uniref:Uncharacterized protein n=1 Tax=Candidatus Hepatoplasma crinochetorum TaxID=295596 RepID=A0A0G7ZNQ1_9MOLU|nr:hypothetical protein HEPPS_05800 [Candidatus Hepatoplasma crinochetorum]
MEKNSENNKNNSKNQQKWYQTISKNKFFKFPILIYLIPSLSIIIIIIFSNLNDLWIDFIEFSFSIFFALLTLIIAIIIDNNTTNNIDENKELINDVKKIVKDINDKLLKKEKEEIDNKIDNKTTIREKENILELEEKIKA